MLLYFYFSSHGYYSVWYFVFMSYCVIHKMSWNKNLENISTVSTFRYTLTGNTFRNSLVLTNSIASFLSGRSQRVLYRGRLSAEWQLLFGVPQGSVLGLIYCSCCIQLNCLTLSQNAVSHATRTLTTHRSTSARQPATTSTRWNLASYIERIRDWMTDNHLKLNEEKTQIIWLGTRQQLNKLSTQALTLPNATV